MDDPAWPAVKDYLEREGLDPTNADGVFRPYVAGRHGRVGTAFFRYDGKGDPFVLVATRTTEGFDVRRLPLNHPASTMLEAQDLVSFLDDETGGVLEIRDLLPSRLEVDGTGSVRALTTAEINGLPSVVRECLRPEAQ